MKRKVEKYGSVALACYAALLATMLIIGMVSFPEAFSRWQNAFISYCGIVICAGVSAYFGVKVVYFDKD